MLDKMTTGNNDLNKLLNLNTLLIGTLIFSYILGNLYVCVIILIIILVRRRDNNTQFINLKAEFVQVLSRNPYTIADYAKSFLDVYGDDYYLYMDKFRKLISFQVPVSDLDFKIIRNLEKIIFLKTNVPDSLIEEKINEAQKEKETNIRHLKENKDYDLINYFVTRYIDGYSEEDFKKLFDILANKNYNIGYSYLKRFIDLEIKNKKYGNFREMILNERPALRKDYLKAFLQNCGESYNEHLNDLDLLLNEHGEDPILDSELDQVNREIELERFEKRLKSNEKLVTIDDIDKMSGYEFEEFLMDLYIRMGYTVNHTKLSGDQGADLIVTKFGESTAVQAKNYQGSVGNNAIMQVVAAKGYYNCDEAAVVASSEFTRSASELAASNKVELIDRTALEKLIEKYM